MVEVNDDKVNYDFYRCIEFMEQKGKEWFGEKFRIEESDHPLIFKLLVYAIGDQENAADMKINLKKGILLSGPVGCGKTCIMKLIQLFQPQEKRFILKSCRDISFKFFKEGYETIQKFSSQSYTIISLERQPVIYCFDDLGSEQGLKHYGNNCNALAEILLSRYDQYISRGMITHITTNLSSAEIEQHYGNRVRSRMREMFNIVAFDRGVRDKRR